MKTKEPIVLDHPPSFDVSTSWKPMSEAFHKWALNLWIELSVVGFAECIPFVCGKGKGYIIKTRGRGDYEGETFVKLVCKEFTAVFNFKSKQVKLKDDSYPSTRSQIA